MDDLIDLVLAFLGLRYLAGLMSTGSAKRAGEKLESDLDEIPKTCASCCLGYLVLMLIVAVLGGVLGLIGAVWHWIVGH